MKNIIKKICSIKRLHRLLNGVLIVSLLWAWVGIPMYVAHQAGQAAGSRSQWTSGLQ